MFPWPEPGTALEDVITPMPVIDETRLADNITRAQEYMSRHNLAFRPHIKTHKLPSVARAQTGAGACGINCQKISEAEVFADAGFDDILITYNILGATRLARLVDLNRRLARLSVVADSETTVAGLTETFAATDKPLTVLVECDTGGGRCGVTSPELAAGLAARIHAAKGLRFAGVMTYPTRGGAAQVEEFLAATVALLAKQGIDCPVRSNGGTPDLFSAHLVPSATEHRAGTYVYNDRAVLRDGGCNDSDLALHVIATVVSRPAADRAILDCGSKTLSSDLLGFDDFGQIADLPGARIVSLSEEHAKVDLSGCSGALPEVGERVWVIPNHVCVVSNLFDRVVFHRAGRVTRVEPVAARGTVW